MKIYLIGYRGTGKTTVGKVLAAVLGLDFQDLDRSIELRAGVSIACLVDHQGWAVFRNLEKQTLMAIDPDSHGVVATGGGVVLDPDNVRFMRATGTVVLLGASERVILDRLSRDGQALSQRPSLTGRSLALETRTVLRERLPLYEGAADIEVDTSILEPQEVARLIAERMGYGRQ